MRTRSGLVRVCLTAFALMAGLAGAVALAAEPDKASPMDWAMRKLAAGEIVDFEKYGPACKPGKPTDGKTWPAACEIPASWIVDLLTNPEKSAAVGHHRMRLRHAHIIGDIDLNLADILPEVWIDDSRIEGNVWMVGAHFHQLLSLDGSAIVGNLDADRLIADSVVTIAERAVIYGGVNMEDAVVHLDLTFRTSVIGGKFSGESLHVGGDMFLNDEKKGISSVGGPAYLNAAVIDGRLFLDEQEFHQTLVLDDVTVGSSVFADQLQVMGKVSMSNARVAGNFAVSASRFNNDMVAEGLTVGNTMFVENAIILGGLDLADAHLTHGLFLTGAQLAQADLSNLETEELLLNGVSWRCPLAPTDDGAASPAQAGSAGATATAQVTGAHSGSAGTPQTARKWLLGEGGWRRATCGAAMTPDSLPNLRLRNAHIGAIQETTSGWPPMLDLSGLHYERLGAFQRLDEIAHPIHNSISEWQDWFDRDRNFTPQPYVQLATVLQGAGLRPQSEAILFAARERERELAGAALYARITHLFGGGAAADQGYGGVMASLARWVYLSALDILVGYGIGAYTFRVVKWLAVLTLIGTLTLYFSPRLRRPSPFANKLTGFAWRFGVSLQKVLPVIEYYKPFKDFLDNERPKPGDSEQRRNLSPVQVAVFSALSLCGWGLSIFLAAAVSGLTQNG